MEPEVVAAIIAGFVSFVGFLITTWWNQRSLHSQLNARKEEWSVTLKNQEEQWQETFRAELRRDLVKESTLEILHTRLELYSEVWRSLKVTAGYHVRRSENLNSDVQGLADALTDFAYSNVGLVMTDRSRRLLNHLRTGCGDFLKGKATISDVQNRAHLLKHSMRSELGIEDYEYESEMNNIAHKLGRVDYWQKS